VSKQQYESGKSSGKSEKKPSATTETNKVRRGHPLSQAVNDILLLQLKRDKFSGLTRRAKRRKMAMEGDETDERAIGASIRSAKKAMRPTKIGMLEPGLEKAKPKKAHGKKKLNNSFDRDLGQRTKTEGIRAKKGDSVGRAGKRARNSR